MSSTAQIPRPKSVASQARIFSTSLTPFLYLTQTLQAQSWDAKFRNPLRRIDQGHRSFCSASRNFAQANATPVHNAVSSENISAVISSVPAKYRINVPGLRRKEDRSLIPQSLHETHWQQGAIDRLCSAISRWPSRNKDVDGDEEYDTIRWEVDLDMDIYEEIAILFDNAIRQVQHQEERRVQSVIKNQALYLKNPLLRAINVSRDLNEIPQITAGPSQETPRLAADEFQAERRSHEEDFTRELERAQSDDDVWSVLDTKVFSLFKFVRNGKQDEASKQNHETGSKLAAQKKPKRKKKDLKQEEIHSPQPPPLHLTPDAIHSVAQHNYGRYCLKALQLLRREFPASQYANVILPTIKRLGPISYVLGATSGLYNELLYLKWTEYADLHGMADILEEMRNQGVQPDEITTAVMQEVKRQRDAQLNIEADEKEGENRPGEEEQKQEQQQQQQQQHHIERAESRNTATAVWWTWPPVHEGWIRLLDNFNAAKKLTLEQQLREAEAEREIRAVEEAERKEEAKEQRAVIGREKWIRRGGSASSATPRVLLGPKENQG